MFQRDSNQKPNLLFYSFSAITNSRSLINQQSRFGALDSLRFLFVLYIHLYHYFNYLSTAGLVTLKRILSTFPSTSLREDKYAWFRTTLPFEPIFIISGLIVGFNVHQARKRLFFLLPIQLLRLPGSSVASVCRDLRWLNSFHLCIANNDACSCLGVWHVLARPVS